MSRPAPESRRGAGLVFRYRDGGELRAVHALEGYQVGARIDHRHVEFPVALLRFGDIRSAERVMNLLPV